MALYQSRGTISDMSDVQSGVSKNGYQWQRMTITLDIPGFQGSIFKQVFQVTGDDVNDVLLFSIGDKVEISWSMYAREWNGKWYNNVDLVKIKHQETKHDAPAPAAPSAPKPQQKQESLDPAENPDDLPF
jgi:hypothetical protein